MEAIRTGEHVGPIEILRRAARHANGLSVCLVLLASLLGITSLANVFFGAGKLLMALVLARFIFVIPAIAIEGRDVLAAFRRSFTLTRGRQWPIAWRIAFSAVATVLIVTLGGAIGIWIGAAVGSGALGFVYAFALGLALASVPVSLALARVGTYWALFHHDLRRDAAARR